MINKLLVTRFEKNTSKLKALDGSGKVLTEIKRTTKTAIEKTLVHDDQQRPLIGVDKTPITHDVIVARIVEEEVPIIPDNIPVKEFTVFQETDPNGINVLRYYLEDGTEFHFESPDCHYEAKIIQRDYKAV